MLLCRNARFRRRSSVKWREWRSRFTVLTGESHCDGKEGPRGRWPIPAWRDRWFSRLGSSARVPTAIPGRGATDLAKAGLPSSSAPSCVPAPCPAPACMRHVSSGRCGHFGVLGGAGTQETCFCGILFPRSRTVAKLPCCHPQ